MIKAAHQEGHVIDHLTIKTLQRVRGRLKRLLIRGGAVVAVQPDRGRLHDQGIERLLVVLPKLIVRDLGRPIEDRTDQRLGVHLRTVHDIIQDPAQRQVRDAKLIRIVIVETDLPKLDLLIDQLITGESDCAFVSHVQIEANSPAPPAAPAAPAPAPPAAALAAPAAGMLEAAPVASGAI